MSSPLPEAFKISVSDELLTWINDRVRTARIPVDKDLSADDLSYGIPRATAVKLHEYWTQKYDWRKIEQDINSDLQQFTVPIQYNGEDLTIHFVHHRSSNANAIPLLFLHGWPGCFLEVRDIIKLLTSPSDPSQQAYHVIAPSLIGFGFSSYSKRAFGPIDQAAVMHKLMAALNYKTYMAQGGDWGSMIARIIALNEPQACLAVHLNMIIATPPSPLWQPLRFAQTILGFATGLGLTAYEKKRFEKMMWWRNEESGYLEIQGTKSQTLQYALADSPFGFLCWLYDKQAILVDKDSGWRWDDAHVITLAMIYIINGTPGHAEMYRWAKGQRAKDFTAALWDKTIPQSVAFGASIFPQDVMYAQKWWAESRIARNIVFWKEHDKGGHFPSLEVPETLVEDVRAFTAKVGGDALVKLRASG